MISFCCPSRGRPELAKRLVDTARQTQKGDTEFLFYLNDDDQRLEEYRDLLDEKHYTIGPNQSTCYSWNLMAEKATSVQNGKTDPLGTCMPRLTKQQNTRGRREGNDREKYDLRNSGSICPAFLAPTARASHAHKVSDRNELADYDHMSE